MTSMPASRRARAMILAPRSWPSRPGLATTTRIFWVVLGADIGEGAAILCGGRGRGGAPEGPALTTIRGRAQVTWSVNFMFGAWMSHTIVYVPARVNVFVFS